MSNKGMKSQLGKWLGITTGFLVLFIAGWANAYYFGPPSATASVTLVDSMGPSAPQGMTVLYNKALNRMEINWSALQNSDDRNYSGYPVHNLHATEPYRLDLRTDNAVDSGGQPVWTTIYSGDLNSQVYLVSYGHKYVFRITGRDESPYDNTGAYRSSTDDPANDTFSAPEQIDDLDAMPTQANSSVMITWEVPMSQSILNYNIYIKHQSVPLVPGDLIPQNLSFTVPASTWDTFGGRTYYRYEHIPSTDLISGGATLDVSYAVCAVDSEDHEADISSGDGNRILNSGFESGSLNWTWDGADATYIDITSTETIPTLPRHSGEWSAKISVTGTDPPPPSWDTVELRVEIGRASCRERV